MKLYRKYAYADLKKVSRQYIYKLCGEGKLKTKVELGVECIVDCAANNALFEKPAHNRRKK